MIRLLHPRSALALGLLLAAVRAGAEPLPENFFKNLAAGKPQVAVVYGTSLTHKGAWVGAVKEYLDQNFPGQVTFVNAAKSGMQSNWGVENFASRVLSQKPDLVFIEFSVNDAATKHGISVVKSVENLDRMVKDLRTQNPQADIVLQTMNPAWDSPETPEKQYGSDRPDIAAYYDGYRRYAAEHNMPLVDNYPVWAEMLAKDPERFHKAASDGIHPHSGPSRGVTGNAVKALLEKARVAAGASSGQHPAPTKPAPAASPAPTPAVNSPAAASQQEIEIWPAGKMPGNGAKEPEGIHDPQRTDAKRVTNISNPTLTVFPAPGRTAPGPAMIVCPGGGYSYVVVDKEGSEIAGWLNSLGVTALVLKYRAPHNRDGALRDLQRALRLTRAKAAGWKIDPSRLGVIGFSAGGHLSASASTRFGEKTYEPLDDADRQSARPDFAVLMYPAYLAKDGKVAPELSLQADVPPMLIIQSEDDEKFVAGTKIFKAALDEAKKTNDFKLYATGGHGYGLQCTRDAREWPQCAADWLRKNGFAPAGQQGLPSPHERP